MAAKPKFDPPLHPICKLFPPLPPDELMDLTEDIHQHGQREPIWLDAEGRLVDGRNRLAACRMADIDPRRERIAPDADPVDFALSKNLRRRHLTASQRGLIFGEAVLIQRAEREKKGKKDCIAGESSRAKLRDGLNSTKPNVCREDVEAAVESGIDVTDEAAELLTIDTAASRAGISNRSINAGIKLARDGDPALKAAVVKGDVSLHAAAKVAELPKEEQRELVKSDRVAQRASVLAGEKVLPETDDLGNHLNESCAIAFREGEKIERMLLHVHALRVDAKKIQQGPAGVHFPPQEIDILCKQIAYALKSSVPHCVCPVCKGKGAGCDGPCKRHGWVTREIMGRWSKNQKGAR